MNAGNAQNLAQNDGFVSLINPDGSVHTSKWIGVARDGLTLNHPLGSAIQGNTLYTVDIDTIRTFDLDTGNPGARNQDRRRDDLERHRRHDRRRHLRFEHHASRKRIYRVQPNGVVEHVRRRRAAGAAERRRDRPRRQRRRREHRQQGRHDVQPSRPGRAHRASGRSGNDGVVVVPDGTKYVSSVRFGSVSRIRRGTASRGHRRRASRARPRCATTRGRTSS